MSRLIDADSITEKIMNVFEEALKTALESGTFDLEGVMLKIKCYLDNQPTAFDVDKVVEQLDDEAELSYADFERYAEEHYMNIEDDDFRFGLRRAIEIVKAGGTVDVTDTNVGKWISVKDRLPEEDEYPEQKYRILASCSDGIVRNATIKSLLYKEEGINGLGQSFTYIAWMPLPEPYKERD